MFARIGVMRALNRGHIREFNPDRKDTHWGKRKRALIPEWRSGEPRSRSSDDARQVGGLHHFSISRAFRPLGRQRKRPQRRGRAGAVSLGAMPGAARHTSDCGTESCWPPLNSILGRPVVHYPVAMSDDYAARFRKQAEECREQAEGSQSY
jgi:hypothetical protein